MSKILKVARAEIGVTEIPGKKHNERILEYASALKYNWIKTDEVPWCSNFVNWVAREAGFERSGKANARSWLEVGLPVESPKPGDVVIFSRPPSPTSGHVAIIDHLSEDGKKVYVIGGNQSNMVKVSPYAINRVLGYRRLRKENK